MQPRPFFHAGPRLRGRHAQAGNAFIVAIVFIAVFAIVVGACYVLSNETGRRATRENRFTGVQVAGDAALDVMYGRFSQWVDAHTGLTPSSADATTAGVPGNAAFPAIAGSITFPSSSGLAGYQVTSLSLVPLMPDGTVGTDFPNASTWAASPSTYQSKVNKYYVNIPNLYEPTAFSNALTYLATVTVTGTVGATQSVTDTTGPQTISVSRYFQQSQVSPFNYNVFTVGTFEDFDWGQSYDSEASIYASVQIKLDHSGTIINGPMRYGNSFVDPTGTSGGVNGLTFQDPTTGATVDPYTSGLLKQVAQIEVVPDIASVIAHNADGTRTASTEFTTAADDFSRREVIEPPALLTGDTAPDQIKQRRIYTQADLRLKVSVATATVGGKSVSVATGTFYNLDGSVQALYAGTINSSTSTSWTSKSGGNSATAAVINAVNVNPVTGSTPFYDPTRTYDSSSLGTGQPGQPSATNSGHAIESIDVNVGTLTTAIDKNGSSFANNTVYIWDDGTSGEKNGVRLYNGGVLPAAASGATVDGLTIGSTNPVYVKGDYNTGAVLSSATDINASVTTAPNADTVGWNNGSMVSYDDRHVSTYAIKPAGIFGDTITTLSQNWLDASSASTTQYARSTTYNAVLGFGSGDTNSLKSDDTFSSGAYATVQTLEYWNNSRWNQLGEQMALYHSVYNKHKSPPAWINNGWVVIQNDFDPGTAHIPLKWGYLVFSRGRYTRN